MLLIYNRGLHAVLAIYVLDGIFFDVFFTTMMTTNGDKEELLNHHRHNNGISRPDLFTCQLGQDHLI